MTSVDAARGASAANVWAPAADESLLESYAKILRDSPWYHRLFVVLVLIETVYVCIERGIVFVKAQGDAGGADEDAIWFLGVIVISVLFAAYYGIHSLLSVNYLELGAFRAVTAWLLVRLVVEFANRGDECEGAAAASCIAFLVVALAFNVLTILLTVWMLPDLKWTRYKAIGADVATHSLYRSFELFSAVRKVDLQFSVITLYTGLVFSTGSLNQRTSQFTLGANAVLLLVELAWEVTGDRAVKRESELYMYTFWCLSIFLPAFVASVAYDAFTDDEILGAATATVRATIGAFAVLGLLNRAATVVCSVVLYRAFGERYRGLRRIFEGGRMRKFTRGARSGAGATAASGRGGSGGGAAGGAAAPAAAAPTATAPPAGAATGVRNPLAAATAVADGDARPAPVGDEQRRGGDAGDAHSDAAERGTAGGRRPPPVQAGGGGGGATTGGFSAHDLVADWSRKRGGAAGGGTPATGGPDAGQTTGAAPVWAER